MTGKRGTNQSGEPSGVSRRVKRITIWSLPLIIILSTHVPVRAQHVAGPIETYGWGHDACSSCGAGGSFFSGSFFSGLGGLFGGRGCRERCPRFFCPPAHHHCAEGPPRVRIRVGCPKPICPPCDNPHWGYYQTCWTPWPWPVDWSHCPVPPPSSQVIPPHTWAAEYLDHINRLQSGAPPQAPGTLPQAPGALRQPTPVPMPAPGMDNQLPYPRKLQ